MKRDEQADVRLTADVTADGEPHRARRDDDAPFEIVVLGDFGQPAGAPTAGPRLIAIDRDNFDAVMTGLAPSWRGTVAAPGSDAASLSIPVALTFRTLDDFHPDRLVRRVELLRVLHDVRRRLLDPPIFEAAAAEVDSP